MNKHIRIPSFLPKKYFFLFLLFSGFGTSAQDLYNLENTKKFANYLNKSGQFDLAAKEYERLVFLQPQNDTLKLNLLSSYRKAGKIDFGILRAQQLFPETNLMPAPAAIEFSKMLISNKLWKNVNQFMGENKTLTAEDKVIINSTSEVFSGNFKRANELLATLPESQNNTINSYKSLVNKAFSEKYKNPWLAGTFSALVPGLGKIYTGDWKDAIVSIIFIGGTGFQAYRGFKESGVHSTKGWIYGSIGFGFYLGDIYGSVKSAKNYNQKKKHRIQHEIEGLFNTYF